MTHTALAPWLLAGLPLLGALACLAFWSNPARVQWSALVWAVLSLGSVASVSGWLATPPEGLLPLYLLPLAAAVSILGQPAHKDQRAPWIMTLVCLGLGIGAFADGEMPGRACLAALLALLLALLFRHHTALWPISWWGIGSFGGGLACLGLSFLTGPPLASTAFLLTCAVLLPLVPLHNGYVTALTRLPGGLPSFIAVLLPVLGLHGLATAIPTAPDTVVCTASLLALAGAFYGAVRALVQSRVRLLLAYGSLSFFSTLWWFAAAARTATPRAATLAIAVGLATSGLLIAWQVVRTRYGDDVDPQAISGLASTMPRYAVLLSLLALAAMGLPPFGVFAGFMGLLLTAPIPSAAGLLIVLLAWLAASWYIMQLAQRLLFGMRRPDLRYTDLLVTELVSLALLVLTLLALGLAPTSLFAPDQAAHVAGVVTDSPARSGAWNR